MRILIENSKFIYRKDSIFRPLIEITEFKNKRFYFREYPTKQNLREVYLNGDEIVIVNENRKHVSAGFVYHDLVSIEIESKTYQLFKGYDKAILLSEGEQVASIFLDLPHSDLLDISFNHDTPFIELSLIILAIVNFKTGFFTKNSILSKLETSSKVDESKQWRSKPLQTAEKEAEFLQEVNRFLTIQHPSSMLFEHRILKFPWLQDTLQYWGERSIELKEKCMSHLLKLLAIVDYDYQNCHEYNYCLSSYKAGLYIYSPDGDWDYEPIGKALKQATTEQTVIHLISILEDSLDQNLFSKYIQPFENHESEKVRNLVNEVRERMR